MEQHTSYGTTLPQQPHSTPMTRHVSYPSAVYGDYASILSQQEAQLDSETEEAMLLFPHSSSEEPETIPISSTKDTSPSKIQLSDPTNHWFIVRFFIGLSYPFIALYEGITKGYFLFSCCQIMFLSICFFAIMSVGITCAIFTVFAINHNSWPMKDHPMDDWFVFIIVVILFATFYNIVLMIFLSVPIQSVIDLESRRLSYIVEKRMYGKSIGVADVCCGDCSTGQGSGDSIAICSLLWWGMIIKTLIMGKIKSFCLALLKNTWRFLTKSLLFFVFRLFGAVILIIPGAGTVIYTTFLLITFLVEFSLLGFDLVMSRHKFTFYQNVRTVWNNLSLLVGLATGLIITMLFPPFLILLYPVTIISCTMLFVHLDANKKTARDEDWFNVFGWYGIRIGYGKELLFETREKLAYDRSIRKFNSEQAKGTPSYGSTVMAPPSYSDISDNSALHKQQPDASPLESQISYSGHFE